MPGRKTSLYLTYFFVAALMLLGSVKWGLSLHRFYQPGLKLAFWTSSTVENVLASGSRFFVKRRSLIHELEQTRENNKQLKRRLAKLRFYREDNRQLRRELELDGRPPGKLVAVRTIATNLTGLERTVYLNRGYHSGIQSGHPLIQVNRDTWVLRGQVELVRPEQARVLLVDDPRFTVGVKIEGVNDREFVLRGQGYRHMHVENFPEVLDAKPGAKVYTAEASLLAPADLLVGRVTETVVAESGERTGQTLKIRPPKTGDLTGINWVLVNRDD